MTILNRLKLLFIREELIDFTLNMDKVYPLALEKQKPTIKEQMDNIEKTIQIMHTRGLKEGFLNDYQKGRSADVAVKLMLITYK
jgi:hypothetical protein